MRMSQLGSVFCFGLAVASLASLACPRSIAGNPGDDESGNVVRLRNTYYVVMLEAPYRDLPTDSELRAMDGTLLATVSHEFRKRLDIEGTGRLLDGRVVNFAGRVEGEIRYFVSDSYYGYGVGKCRLAPFRTIAVDPKVVPLGSLVYIAETDGLTLPDGTHHDGYWHADDIGGAIKHDRVDLFIGDSDNEGVIERNGIKNLQPLTVTIVKLPTPDSCVYKPTFGNDPAADNHVPRRR